MEVIGARKMERARVVECGLHPFICKRLMSTNKVVHHNNKPDAANCTL